MLKDMEKSVRLASASAGITTAARIWPSQTVTNNPTLVRVIVLDLKGLAC
jgi:hypothetical protein